MFSKIINFLTCFSNSLIGGLGSSMPIDLSLMFSLNFIFRLELLPSTPKKPDKMTISLNISQRKTSPSPHRLLLSTQNGDTSGTLEM